MAARLAAENQKVQDWLAQIQNHPHFVLIHKALKVEYEKLRLTLGDWERAARERQHLIGEGLAKRSDDLYQNALMKTEEARHRFRQTFARWKSFRGLVLATA